MLTFPWLLRLQFSNLKIREALNITMLKEILTLIYSKICKKTINILPHLFKPSKKIHNLRIFPLQILQRSQYIAIQLKKFALKKHKIILSKIIFLFLTAGSI